MMSFIKNIFKYYFSGFLFKEQRGASVQLLQKQMALSYLAAQKNNTLPPITETGFKVFSQFEEDGYLLYLFTLIGHGGKKFIEIGANDGINSNCSNLCIHFGWSGLFFEGNDQLIKRGQRFYAKYPTPYHPKPIFKQAIVTRENINQLIQQGGLEGEIDLLSIDIDGNDYWVWEAIEQVNPRVVIIETHVEFGLNPIVVPYDPNYMYPGKHPVYHGASPVAMQKLAQKKGYRLVAANELGINHIYLRNDLGIDDIPEIQIESTLTHPKTIASFKDFDPIKDWEYIRVI
jgi:hypothetical protein